MRTWLLVLAVAVTAAGIVLFVLAREQPEKITVAARDAAATPPIAQPHEAPPVVAVRADAAIDAAPSIAPELATLRSSGTSNEIWIPQAKNLLRGFDPHAEVECYVAGCAAALHFDLDNAYQDAVDVVRADQTWTGGKKFLPAVRGQDGTITAVLILYRPD